MVKKAPFDNERARLVVAQEAARLIVDQGIRDYGLAKKKAAQRLGLSARGSLPGNSEIEAAIAEHLKLFGGEEHVQFLRAMRTAALSAMQILAGFSPRLVGPVLKGTADENSAINLHVFTDSAEAVGYELEADNIRYKPYERRLKSRRNVSETFMGYEFTHSHSIVQATVFPEVGIRQAPLSPVDGKPMDRADAKRVQAMLSQV